jgi:hypothetical protein
MFSHSSNENIHALLSGKTLCQDEGEDDDETSTDDDNIDHDGKVITSTYKHASLSMVGEELSAMFCNRIKDALVKRGKTSSLISYDKNGYERLTSHPNPTQEYGYKVPEKEVYRISKEQITRDDVVNKKFAIKNLNFYATENK